MENFFEFLAKVRVVAVACFLPGRTKDLSAPGNSSDCGIHIGPFLRCLYIYGKHALTSISRGRKPKFRDFFCL